MSNRIPVFYRPEQSCDAAVGYSPSAGKPAKVVADWLSDERIAPHIQIETFKAATDGELCLAHDPAYVAGILDGSIANGFGNTSHEVVESLRYTTGSILAAARYVMEHNRHACSPTSGFHHAGYDFGGGYCTFNGLAMTLLALKDDVRVGILDCDAHWANGTVDVLAHKRITDPRHHHTQGAFFRSKADVGHEALKYFDWLNTAMSRMGGCDLILYQAGADPHINDPLGGLLTTEQMEVRDRLVFQRFKHRPLVWNLAGGYQRDKAGTIQPVLALHRQTMLECIAQNQRRR